MRAALVVVLAALLGAPAVAAAAPAAATPGASVGAHGLAAATEDEDRSRETQDDDALPVEVHVEQVTPVLQPGGDLTVAGTLHHRGDTTLEVPRVVVRLDRSAFVTRTSLDRWRDAADDAAAGTTLLTVNLAQPLAPGASLPFSVVVPAASVGLRSSSAWGPRGVAVEVVDRGDSARRRQGLARTLTVWFPEQEVTPTRVSVLVPLVGPAFDPHAVPEGSEDSEDAGDGADGDEAADDATTRTEHHEELEALTTPGGRLADVLDATAASTAVTWLLDPWLLEQAASVPADDDTSATAGSGNGGATTGGSGAATWTETLVAATRGRDVALLPYGDADPAALAHAGALGPWDLAWQRSAASAAALGVPVGLSGSLVLPAERLPDVVTAGLAAAGGRALVVGPGALEPSDELTYTASSRTTADTPGGEATVLVPDERLSEALEHGSVGPRPADGDRGVDPQLTAATAAQDVLAELAVITRERPSQSRHLLLSAPRDWDPDPAVAAAQLAALATVPWVRLQPVSTLLSDPAEGVEHDQLPRRQVAPEEMPASEIAAVDQTLTERARLAAIAEHPEELMGAPEVERLAPLSVAWRDDATGRTALVAASQALTASIRDAVVVEVGSEINLISTSGELPVLVQNTLDQAVTVQVVLRPGDRLLIADEAVTVTLPARGQEQVRLPVRAVQSADVQVAVELRGPDGVVLDDRTTLTVHVRAEWEGIGAAVIGGLLAIGLVIGVVRTVRRGRAASRAAPVAAGPDALSPEEAEEADAQAEEAAAGDAGQAGQPRADAAHDGPRAGPVVDVRHRTGSPVDAP